MRKQVNPVHVYIEGLDGCFSEEEIVEIQSGLKNAGIGVKISQRPYYAINGIEIFFPQIKVLLSETFVLGIATGIIGNVFYDGFKGLCKLLWRVIQRKELLDVRKQEKCAPNIHLIAGKFHAILPKDVTDEEYDKFVNGFIAAINKETIAKENYYYYDPKTKQTAIFSKGKLLEIVSGGKYLNNEE